MLPCLTLAFFQVYGWMLWLAKELRLDTTIIKDLKINGKELTSMSINNFLIKIPYANYMLSHLTLLKVSNRQLSLGVYGCITIQLSI